MISKSATRKNKQDTKKNARGKKDNRRNARFGKFACITIDSKFPLIRNTSAKFNMKVCNREHERTINYYASTINQEDWTVYWTDGIVSADWCKQMKPHQRINRFPGISAISCKDLLAQNLNRLYAAFPKSYNIFPRTWCLPHDYANITAYAISYPRRTFIVKPTRGSEGRGIYITRNLQMIKPHDRMICQVYISRPFLIDGYKFDMRIYALIASIDPLRIYVYNDGLTRFATKKFQDPSVHNMNDKFMHLTNYSVNRRSIFYVGDEKAGSKRSILTINKWFAKKGFNVKRLWASIDDVIVKTVLVALPTLRRYYSECFPGHLVSTACFQLLGFDIILDHRLKPYVLEVNYSPSMNTSTHVDTEVKSSLLYDTFRLLNLKFDERVKIANATEKQGKIRERGDRPYTLYNASNPTDPISPQLQARYKLIIKNQLKSNEEHLGNYRKVYPNKNVKRYRKIMEYVDRLKWPSLHRVVNQSDYQNDTLPYENRRFDEPQTLKSSSMTSLGKPVGMSDSLITIGNIFLSNSNSMYQLDEEYHALRETHSHARSLVGNNVSDEQDILLNHSVPSEALASGVDLRPFRNYSFIDRITTKKVDDLDNSGDTTEHEHNSDLSNPNTGIGASDTTGYDSAHSDEIDHLKPVRSLHSRFEMYTT